MKEQELNNQILNWFATGRVGLSSKAMALHALGKPSEGDHPHDPDDLNRCLLLLEAAPLVREKLPQMAEMSKQWARLIPRWQEIEQCFLDEVGLDWTKANSAKKTYDLMFSILYPKDA